MQSGEYFKVTIVVNGVKKRARKTDRHFLHAGYIPYNNGFYDIEQVETLAKNFTETNIKEVIGKINIHSYKYEESDGQIQLNELCKVHIKTAENVSFDSYKHNRKTGAFILINENTNNTVAAGVIL